MGNQLEKAPELQWLKSGSIHATPEGIDTEDKEYKRTMCSIRLLDYVLKNDYLAFVAAQPMNQRLSEDSLNHQDFHLTLQEKQILLILSSISGHSGYF